MDRQHGRQERVDFHTSPKYLAAWILGALFMMAGTWVIQNLQLNIGVTIENYVLALLVAFVFFLAGGLLWIAVAVATRLHL
ncbi:MAG: hypothetical protein HY519_03915 [Candidatus Aenigmarchaeota archaeon]|nr:hypothetical protein [Candidatus Aenigmarchaeota archaeon]